MSHTDRRLTDAASAQPASCHGSYEDKEWDITTGVGLTALAVAAGRAIETDRPDRLITDRHAARFVQAAAAPMPLPTEWPPAISAWGATRGLNAREVTEFWRGMATYIGVRTRFFDLYFASASGSGLRQVVLLGAGLDTRAFRLDWPDTTGLFEIDHSNVLAFKDKVLDAEHAEPRCERHAVGVDLRDEWPAALLAAGLDPAQPTAWLAEGLLFFLPDDAKRQLVGRLHGLSAPASQWAVESFAQPAKVTDYIERQPVLREMAIAFGLEPTALWPPGEQWEPYSSLLRRGWTVTAASAHTVAARYGRVLDGTFPIVQHPSVLVTAACEQPTYPDRDGPDGSEDQE